MKKTLLHLILALALSLPSWAQQWVSTKGEGPSTLRTELVSSSETSILVRLQVPGFYAHSVVTPRGDALQISIPRTVSTFDAGEPQLPIYAIPAIIGDNALMRVRIKDAQYVDFENYEVAPSKGDFPRTIDPDDVPYTYGPPYSNDAFFPEQQAGLYEPYILRDFRGQNMVLYPFAYNPITKTLRVYYDMTVEMYRVGTGGENQLARKSNDIRIDQEINAVYDNHFINFGTVMNRYTPMNETGELLIICHDAFMSAMEPFVNWKKQIGRPTTIVGTSTAGTSYSAIKSYIQAQYNSNNNISHVLLVGDVAQIPGIPYEAGSGYYGYSGKSDNMYGQVVGNDLYNDIIVGRFSAENTDHVTTQVNKVIHYEKDITAADNWVTKGSGVATTSGPGHFNEQDWQHIDNIRTDLLAYNYTEVYRDYQNAGGANSNATTLSQHINDGLTIINYCNHGSETSWGVFNYSNSHINALTNVNKLPIVWSVACLNGKYDHGTPCFAETWLRANNNSTSSPTGAIGAMMSYISQPWEPPMYGQDEMVDVLVENYSSNIKRTLGGVSFDGNMKVLDQYGQTNNPAKGTYLAWILFGDPTLTLRNAVPANMGVTHAASMNTTSTSFTVNAANGNGALATLTRNNEIMGSATITNGSANITFTAPGQSGTATLTVFGYNKITYIATVNIASGGGPDPLTVQTTATPSIIPQGGSSTLRATATGGTGSYTYSWTPTTGLSNSQIQNPTATPTQTTTYTCTVTSGTANANSAVTVTVVKAPTNLTATVQNTNNVRLNWTAANPATTYKVYRNNTMIAQNITATNFTDNNLNPGTYNYQVATVYNGVESPKSNTATITIAAPLSVTVTATPATIASGSSSQLKATATGGSGSYSYSWTPVTGLNNSHIQSPTATPAETTTYTCTVTSGTASASNTVTVTVVKAPTEVQVALEAHPVITWTASQPYTNFNIYRGTERIASGITAMTYTDSETTPCPEEEYCYSVATVHNAVEVKSDEACATMELNLPLVENAEGEYTCYNEPEGWKYGATLSWKKPNENVPCWDLMKFNIRRNISTGKEGFEDWEIVATVPFVEGQTDYTYFDQAPVGNSYGYVITTVYQKNGEEREGLNTDLTVLNISVTGIGEQEAKIAVYPNPTKGLVKLEGASVQHVSIVNVYGQILLDAETDGNPLEFDLSSYGKGIYMMQITSDFGHSVKRIVVE